MGPRSGWSRNSPTWCPGAGNSSRPPAPGQELRPPRGPHLCDHPRAGLPAAAAAKFTQSGGQKETRGISSSPAPSPKRTPPGRPGPLPPPPRWDHPQPRAGRACRGSAPGRLPAGRPPLPRGPLPSRRGPGFPSAPPPRAPRRPRSPPESCFHGSLGRPLLTNSRSSPAPIPPPLGTSLRRSPSGSHHTPAPDPRLRAEQGRRERSAAHSGPRGCARGPWGPETASPTRRPGAPAAIHPRRSRRLLALLPALGPSPCRTRTRAPRPPGFARPGRPACPAPLPAPRPPAVASSGAPAPGPPRSPSSFSAVCPVKTLPGSRVPTTANPPLVTSSLAAPAAGSRLLWQRPPRPGRSLGGLGGGAGAGRLRGAGGARGAREARRAAAARLLPALGAGCGASATKSRSCAIRAQGNWGDVSPGPAPDVEDNYSLLLLLLHTGCWRRVVTEPRVDCSARWNPGLRWPGQESGQPCATGIGTLKNEKPPSP